MVFVCKQHTTPDDNLRTFIIFIIGEETFHACIHVRHKHIRWLTPLTHRHTHKRLHKHVGTQSRAHVVLAQPQPHTYYHTHTHPQTETICAYTGLHVPPFGKITVPRRSTLGMNQGRPALAWHALLHPEHQDAGFGRYCNILEAVPGLSGNSGPLLPWYACTWRNNLWCVCAHLSDEYLVWDNSAGFLHLCIEGNEVRAAHDLEVLSLLLVQHLQVS